MDMELKDETVEVRRETELGYEIIEAQLPVVISVTKTDYELRYPTVRSKLAARKHEIKGLSQEDLKLDNTRIGLHGSPTHVKKTFTPDMSKKGIMIREESAEDAVKALMSGIESEGVL